MPPSKEEKLIAVSIMLIVDRKGTKAGKARALFDLGCDRTEVVELLEMSYSQAHSIWKARSSNGIYRRDRSVDSGSVSAASGRLHHHTGSGRATTGLRLAVSEDTALEAADQERPTFFLSPSQVRYITQDGHVIVRIDKASGPECRQCGQPLDFSLKHLGFVHKFSHAEPTASEDHYYGC